MAITVTCPYFSLDKSTAPPTLPSFPTRRSSDLVTNNGTGTAHGFSISDTLPAGLTWAIDSAHATATGSAITTVVLSSGRTATDLAPSASVHVHVTATSSSANCPSISNTASASHTNEPSGVLTNNSSTKVITVNCADLTLIKVRDATTPATVSAGDHV